MGRSDWGKYLGIFVILCFLAFFNQAQGRPGKAFHPCGSYFISYSKEQALAIAIPVEKGSEISEKPTAFGVIYYYSRVFPPPSVKGSKRLPSARKPFNSLPLNILSILIALLFGIGCGAITSISMYLVWALLTNRYASPDVIMDLGYRPIPASANISK